MYKRIVRPLLFHLPPERAHGFTAGCMQLLLRLPGAKALLRRMNGVPHSAPIVELWDIPFKGYVGLAAGFDKDGTLLDNADCLGFSFMEVGTITPKPQPGNPKPRLFRLPQDHAFINRMGFNSLGLPKVEERLAQKRKHRIPIIGNIGKNTATDNEHASQDYLDAFTRLYPLVDLFTLNVSCPNVQSLCDLQNSASLTSLLKPLMAFRTRQRLYRPIMLKLSPDTPEDAIATVVQTAQALGVDAFVASNTTNRRDGLQTDTSALERMGRGGLSGAPLLPLALNLVRAIRRHSAPGTPIIGVGGIARGEEALAMLQAGATLVEIFTGFIYEGPLAARRINQFLLRHRDEIPNWLDPLRGNQVDPQK